MHRTFTSITHKNPTIHVGNYTSVDRILWDKNNTILFNPTKTLGISTISSHAGTKIPNTNRHPPKVPWVHMTYTLDLGVWAEPTSTFNAPSVLRFFTSQDEAEKMRSFPKTNKRATETKCMDSKWIDNINCIYIYMYTKNINSNLSLNNLFAPALITTQDQQKVQKYIIKKIAASIRNMLIDYRLIYTSIYKVGPY